MYRETRSGSTWLCNFLCKHLDKKHIFLDTHSRIVEHIKPNDEHARYLFSTHHVESIFPAKDYVDPLIIRCTRRDSFEQMLSEFFLGLTYAAVTNIFNEQDEKKFNSYLANQRISTATEDDVKKWVITYKIKLEAWNIFSKGRKVQTIYYEDFFEGTTLEGVDLLIKFDDTSKKLPDYKETVFVNYDQIREWFIKLS